MGNDTLLYEWNLFKDSWSKTIVKDYLFHQFDNYLLSNVWKQETYLKDIDKILINNTCVNSIKIKKNVMFIYESPFYIKLNNYYPNRYIPAGLLIENIISIFLKFIVNNSKISATNIINDYYNNNNDDDDDDD